MLVRSYQLSSQNPTKAPSLKTKAESLLWPVRKAQHNLTLYWFSVSTLYWNPTPLNPFSPATLTSLLFLYVPSVLALLHFFYPLPGNSAPGIWVRTPSFFRSSPSHWGLTWLLFKGKILISNIPCFFSSYHVSHIYMF